MPKSLPLIDTTSPICCAPLAAAPLSNDAALEVALRLKALADPARVQLMSVLLSTDLGEVCTCQPARRSNIFRCEVTDQSIYSGS